MAVGYVAMEVGLVHQSWERQGWFTIDAQECLPVIKLDNYDDSIYVYFTGQLVNTDGQTYVLKGPNQFCANPSDIFEKRGSSRGSMRQCSPGEELRPYSSETAYLAPHPKFGGYGSQNYADYTFNIGLTDATDEEVRRLFARKRK